MSGTLFIVATPIGNLEDITARALRVLRSVALIAAEDTRRTAGLLAHFGIATPTLSLHEHNESARVSRLVERLGAGDSVAVVSDAGTPTVSDPGQKLVRAAIEAGIRVEAVPGPSAITAAIAASGFEAEAFCFLGFPPTKGTLRRAWLDRLSRTAGLVVFFEAPHRIAETLRDVSSVVASDSPAVICRELTKAHEELVRGPISEIVTRLGTPRGEYTVVIEIGQKTEHASVGQADAIDWIVELGEIAKNDRVSKRQAINVLARRTGLPPNEVYAAVERAKKSGK